MTNIIYKWIARWKKSGFHSYVKLKIFIGIIFIGIVSIQPISASDGIKIQQIAKGTDMPFLLDNHGHVWASNKLLNGKFIQLPNLNNIVQLAPYAAVDRDGHVYIWGFSTGGGGPELEDIPVKYTKPKKVKELEQISYVTSNAGHFAAIDKSGHIFHWYGFTGKFLNNNKMPLTDYTIWRNGMSSTYDIDYPTMRAVHSDKKAIKIAINWRGILALNEDGSVYGWGISPTGQEIVSNDPISNKVEFNISESYHVTDIALNQYHTAFVSEGKIHFYGGCDLGGKNANRHPWSAGAIVDYIMPLEHIKNIDLVHNDNSYIEDIALGKDGSVWLMIPPPPPNLKPKDGYFCDASYRIYVEFRDIPPYKKIDIVSVKIKQVVPSYVLAEDGTVWSVNGYDRLTKINIGEK
ncbi:MAG: hypothetical protein PHO62_05160 [Sulfurimonas sp.]|uniref:hypothetical protein n=1 Tax=Sulfurimonas sp. TaxID=2022749 RepID=UPI00262EF976|nr:hypothetical protein [Sulfurimonas sp.]MDD5372796.1 hypothetical protein [Sulfurimonas sp.]